MPYHRVVFATLALLMQLACTRLVQGPSEATLAVSTHLEGITAPCGCTSRPLGGLDRIAHAVQADRLPFMVLGNTFMTERAPQPSMLGYVRTTAQIVANIVAELRPVAVAAGPWDVGPMGQVLRALPEQTRGRLHIAQAGALTGTLPRSGRVVEIQGLKVGIIEGPSMPPEPAAMAQGTSKANSVAFAAQDTGTEVAAQALSPGGLDVVALGQEAKRLREQGAVGVIYLWPHGTDQARAQLTEIQGIDIVIAGSEEAPKPPEPLGSGTLLDGGARGEFLGLVHIKAGTGAPLRFFDGGQGELAALTAQHERFVAEAQRLPQGPGRAARLQRAAALKAGMDAVDTKLPQSHSFTWEARPMDQHLPQAPWATEALKGYNKALCETAMADTAARTCPPGKTPAATYVGTATCQACHHNSDVVWQKTAHSRAWATLEHAGKTCDLSCVGCHVVGFEQPGGFCHLADAEPFINVGCESCHGPGLGHVQNPNNPSAWAANFVRNPPEATCKGCHNSQHSDQFDFATYRPKVLGPGHGMPLEP